MENIVLERMTIIFNEWYKRSIEKEDEFTEAGVRIMGESVMYILKS